MSSIIQPWVEALGLRHQGVLINACRGCDTCPKEDASKALTRAYRASVLVCFCGDPAKSRSYIESVSVDELDHRMAAVASNHDHLPLHYVTHLIHAAEIVGYYHPDAVIRSRWHAFYHKMCGKIHMHPESQAELDARLGADEQTFGDAQA